MDKLPLESGWIGNNEQPAERPGSWAFQMALSLLGPLFFLSYLFSLVAPLPFLYLHVGTPNARRGRTWALIAFIVGLALCFAVKGWFWGSLLFFLFVSLPAFVLGEILIRKGGPERAVLGAAIAVAISAAVCGWGITHYRGVGLVSEMRKVTEQFVRETTDRVLSQEKNDLPDNTKEELKELQETPSKVFEELPGVALALLLALCTLPCVALIRWNPKGFLRRTGIPRDFLRKWRTPEWFVWPALICGTFLLFEVEIASDVARNLLKPVLLIYFFQGMSILAYFLDSLRLRGPFRVVFYGAAIMFLLPLVVGFGFFDLWFNFRGRNKSPVDEEKES